MRTLGFALVLAALVFTTGGVAVVGRADTAGAELQQSVAPTQSVAPAKKLPAQCGTTSPKKATSGPKRYRNATAQKAALPANAIPLNTRGYNYGAPEMPQLPPDAKP